MALLLISSLSLNVEADLRSRPNIVLIVADDMAFSDIGAFGGEIDTPNLDALAERGLRFTRFYTGPTCTPSRAMLLTGVDHHRVGLGTMAELKAPEQQGRDGYQGWLTRSTQTIAERMRSAGYRTLMVGKWHLGRTTDTSPFARGFDRSFALLQGAHNHFGFDQDQLYVAAGAQSLYREDDRMVRYPIGAYSSDHFTTRMIEFLKEEESAHSPIFAYLAFTAPHFPLQARDKDIAKYRGKYIGGPEQLRTERIARMKNLDVLSSDWQPYPFKAAKWENLAVEQRAVEMAKMETYAAMVDNLDQNVGRLIETLKDLGRLDNTLIIFMSDNGPDGMNIDGPINFNDIAQGTPGDEIDNSAANIGRPNSFVSYGASWAQAGSAPFRGIKGSVSDGGIHAPLIVAGARVAGGGWSDAVLHVTDIVPTILEIADVPVAPATATHENLPLEGKSWAKLLSGRASTVRQAQDELYWELYFQRAVRKGNLKASFLAEIHPRWCPGGRTLAQTQWQLFDLSTDPGETNDISAARPDELKDLVDQWQAWAADTGVVMPVDQEEFSEGLDGKNIKHVAESQPHMCARGHF